MNIINISKEKKSTKDRTLWNTTLHYTSDTQKQYRRLNNNNIATKLTNQVNNNQS